jgi:hypothetical protein
LTHFERTRHNNTHAEGVASYSTKGKKRDMISKGKKANARVMRGDVCAVYDDANENVRVLP